MNNKTRTVFFIDGFNLYHAINQSPHLHKYKWLDYKKLAEGFIRKDEIISKIYYFTAIATWNPDKVKRHRQFITALEDKSIEIIYGEFKVRDKFCSKCRTNFKTHEEKQTDVNIAIQLLKSASLNEYDRAFIISGDSDLIAAIKTVKELHPSKEILVIIPVGRQAEQLKKTCDGYIRMKALHLQNSRMPNSLTLSDGRVINCPAEWL